MDIRIKTEEKCLGVYVFSLTFRRKGGTLSLTLVSSKVMGQTLRADGERINRWLGIEEF